MLSSMDEDDGSSGGGGGGEAWTLALHWHFGFVFLSLFVTMKKISYID